MQLAVKPPARNSAKTGTGPVATDAAHKVIVYYFGGGLGQSSDRTVVALQNMGAGPIEKDTGTVVKFNKHALTIKTGSGAEENFQIGDTAVAETATGAVRAEKFDPEKGKQVRVIAGLDQWTEDPPLCPRDLSSPSQRLSVAIGVQPSLVSLSLFPQSQSTFILTVQ